MQVTAMNEEEEGKDSSEFMALCVEMMRGRPSRHVPPSGLCPDRPPYGFDLQGPMLECVSELGQRDNCNQKTLSTVALVRRKTVCVCVHVTQAVFVLAMLGCQSSVCVCV